MNFSPLAFSNVTFMMVADQNKRFNLYFTNYL